MLNRLICIFSIASLLHGCGGDSGSSAPSAQLNVKTGVFVDSPVEGLAYYTSTQSGITNDKGQFQYVEGEYVGFSIGAVKLGRAKGSEVITPFDLVGSNPITNEARISATLKSTDVTSFDRAINIATLLQALDRDGDPTNGIELGEANTVLANSTINLSVKAENLAKQQDFVNALNKLQIRHHRSYISAAEHLYNSLSIEVESDLISTMSSSENKSATNVTSYSYNDQRLIESKSIDFGNNGTIDQHIIYEYDSKNRLVSTSDTILGSVETITYDSQNNIHTKELDHPNNNLDLRQTYTYEQSRLTKLETDHGNDGSIDSISTYQYDENDNLVTYAISHQSSSSSITSYTYYGNNIKTMSEDSDGDGEADFQVEYNYDVNGNVLSNISTRVTGNTFNTTVSRFKYNQDNLPTYYERDDNQDGSPEQIEAFKYTSNGKLKEHKKDKNGNGSWDSITQYAYDSFGNRTLMVEDSDGNGIADRVWEASYQTAKLDRPWEAIQNQL